MNQLNIYQKLASIQSETGQMEKKELNKFQNYKYFTEYQALVLLKPLLEKQKIALTFTDEIENMEVKKEETNYIVKYCKRVILTNSENPSEQLTFNFWAVGASSDPAKAKGAADTYAIKYFLKNFFLVPTSDNLDPDREKFAGKIEPSKEDKKVAKEFLAKHGWNTK